MNWKAITALLGICLGLGLFLFLQNKSSEKVEPERDYLIKYELADIVSFRITYLDTVYSLKKKNNRWMIQRQEEFELADSMVVNHLLRTLSLVPALSSISADSIDLAFVRLDPPAITFAVRTQNGDSTALHLGVLNPTTENIYGRRSGENRVLLISQIVGPLLGFNSFMLAGKELIDVNPYAVEQIRYSDGRQLRFSARRSAKTGQWFSNEGKILLDKVKILSLLSGLSQSQIRKIPDTESSARLSSKSLKKTLRKLSLRDSAGKTNEIILGGTFQEKDYFRWAGTDIYAGGPYLVDSRLLGELDKFNADYLKDYRISNFNPGRVDRIELVTEMDSLVLVSEIDTLWNIVAPEQIPARMPQVEQLLLQIDTISALQELPAASKASTSAFDFVQLRLTLYSANEVVTGLEVGDYAPDNSIYIREVRQKRVFLCPVRYLNFLHLSFKDLADIPIRHQVR